MKIVWYSRRMGHDGEVCALDEALVEVRLWEMGKAMDWPLCGKHICQIPQRRWPQGGSRGQARVPIISQKVINFLRSIKSDFLQPSHRRSSLRVHKRERR